MNQRHESTELKGINVTAYASLIDGTLVVELDTTNLSENSNGPVIAVYLNDGLLFENRKGNCND